MILKFLLFSILLLFLFSITVPAQNTHLIRVSKEGFIPNDITINAGDKVVWQWVSGSHIITSDYETVFDMWNTELWQKKPVFEKIFSSPGEVKYYCKNHSEHFGSIYVIDLITMELISFSAQLQEGVVLITWEIASDLENKGFEIERQKENGKWLKIAFIEGKNSGILPQIYTFEDKDITENGTYYYRIKQIDLNGVLKYYDKFKIKIGDESSFELFQNFPNPFNPITNVKYFLPEKSHVIIIVYNVLGNKVADLVDEEKAAGSYEVTFDGSQLSSGIYYLHMKAGKFKNIIKMILVR